MCDVLNQENETKEGKKKPETGQRVKRETAKRTPGLSSFSSPACRPREICFCRGEGAAGTTSFPLPLPKKNYIVYHYTSSKKRSEKKRIRLSRPIFSRMRAYLRFRFVRVWICYRSVTIVPIERRFCIARDRIYLKTVFSRTLLFHIVLEVKLIESFIERNDVWIKIKFKELLKIKSFSRKACFFFFFFFNYNIDFFKV